MDLLIKIPGRVWYYVMPRMLPIYGAEIWTSKRIDEKMKKLLKFEMYGGNEIRNTSCR